MWCKNSEQTVESAKCRACGKFFQKLLSHLKRVKTCQAVYDMSIIETDHYQSQLEKKRKIEADKRKSLSEVEKEKSRLYDKVNKAKYRQSLSEVEKENLREKSRLPAKEEWLNTGNLYLRLKKKSLGYLTKSIRQNQGNLYLRWRRKT